MPQLKFTQVVSSSEAHEWFEASNLLDTRKSRSFKGKAGKNSNVVILKLSKEDIITYIDVGNEFSAFIEVLVAKSCYDNPEYVTLLHDVALMEPGDSRKEKNGNKVHRYSKTDFYPAAQTQKWDLVKIVCRQPFNKKIPYGISFITVIGGIDDFDSSVTLTPLGCVIPSIDTTQRTKEKVIKPRTYFDEIEDLIEKEEQMRKSSITTLSTPKIELPNVSDPLLLDSKGRVRGSSNVNDKKKDRLAQWKMLKAEREKSILCNKNNSQAMNMPPATPKHTTSTNGTFLTRLLKDEIGLEFGSTNNNSLDNSLIVSHNTDSKREDSPTENKCDDSFDDITVSDNVNESSLDCLPSTSDSSSFPQRTPSQTNHSFKRSSLETSPSSAQNGAKRSKHTFKSDDKNTPKTPSSQTKSPLGKTVNKPNSYLPNITAPLQGVVFTLSGFQNPERTNLRDKALSLGATYANDVTPSVTHIISAFRNTPKARKAGSSVHIVSSFWVDRCKLERRRLDENLFSLKK